MTKLFYTIQDCWTHYIVKACSDHNITLACLGPGSRSTPLISALVDTDKIEKIVHIDERSLAYFALGSAKITRKPVLIVTTSGTAVANLLPAVIEAYYDNIPLLIVTADRPAYLQEIGVNQTIKQDRIFNDFVYRSHAFPLPSEKYSIKQVYEEVSSAINLCKRNKGPVHINCPFSKPLIEKTKKDFLYYINKQKTKSLFGSRIDKKRRLLKSPDIKALQKECLKSKRTVIFVGKCPNTEVFQVILEFAEKQSIPIFADILSHHAWLKHPLVKCGMEHLFDSKIKPPDLIISIGDKFSSKSILKGLETYKGAFIQIHFYQTLYNPTSRKGLFWFDPSLRCLSSINIEKKLRHNWVEGVQTKPIVNKIFCEQEAIDCISSNLRQNHLLVAANSLPIRLLNNYSIASESIETYSNRGASGIDGIIATAIGCSFSTKKEVVLIIGDMSFIYDMTALDLIHSLSRPIKIIILNNYGGGIFKQLELPVEEAIFNKYFYSKHSYNFKHIGQQYQIKYTKVSNKKSLITEMPKYLNRKKSEIIEITF